MKLNISNLKGSLNWTHVDRAPVTGCYWLRPCDEKNRGLIRDILLDYLSWEASPAAILNRAQLQLLNVETLFLQRITPEKVQIFLEEQDDLCTVLTFEFDPRSLSITHTPPGVLGFWGF